MPSAVRGPRCRFEWYEAAAFAAFADVGWGTLLYMAPEAPEDLWVPRHFCVSIVFSQVFKLKLEFKSDIWSVRHSGTCLWLCSCLLQYLPKTIPSPKHAEPRLASFCTTYWQAQFGIRPCFPKRYASVDPKQLQQTQRRFCFKFDFIQQLSSPPHATSFQRRFLWKIFIS